MAASLSHYFIIPLSPRPHVPLTLTLSPAFAEAASRRQAPGERKEERITLSISFQRRQYSETQSQAEGRCVWIP